MIATLDRFAHDRNGNFSIAMAAAMVAVVAGAGMAINTVSMINAKSRMANALDTAMTSTARDITTGKIAEQDARKSIQAFLDANADGSAFGGTITLDKLVIDKAAKTMAGYASIATPKLFPMASAVVPERLTTVSKTTYSDKKIEVSMVLDITGSMAGTKIADLKKAASNAVSLFLADQDPAKPRVRVAVVPYSNSVNTGPLASAVFVEKKGGTDVPPGLDDPRTVVTAPDKCATERKVKTGIADVTDRSPKAAMVNRDDRLGSCPSAALQPLTADKAALTAGINAFQAYGATAGHIGIQFGWYLLSPNWKQVLPTSAEPENKGAKDVSKYAIIMTDGEFNTAYVGDNGAYASTQTATALCAAMRKDGIEIFTVGFMLTTAQAKQVLKSCASPDGKARHFYDTANGSELDAAFKAIAANIERLTLAE